jgi:hypothetical protein
LAQVEFLLPARTHPRAGYPKRLLWPK